MKYSNYFSVMMEVLPAETDVPNSASIPFSPWMMENQVKVLKNDIKLKKRFRGKRKPKRKENRRRARPGKSRSGFLTIGAPFNNNEFLINQRDATLATTSLGSEEGLVAKNCGQCPSPHSTSSSGGSESTSDYESLHSPSASSSSGCSIEAEYPQDDKINDEMFDIDFALQNFEADYSAHQWELKTQLMTLPRQQLESRCSLLMDQVKDLEERVEKREEVHVQELELELEALRKENRRLKRVSADSSTPE
nr:uncharacterized protein LOC129257747 [Lytechinus pictus]